MGMFDRVWADCPECGKRVEFQSKAGGCTLKDYHIDSLPPEIARDLAADSEECNECGFVLYFHTPHIQRVSLTVKHNPSLNYD